MTGPAAHREDAARDPKPGRAGGAPLTGLLSVALGLALWAALAASGLVSGILLPPPAEMARVAGIVLTEGYAGVSFWTSYAVSMARLAIGFGAAVIVGAAIGVAMGRSRVLSNLLYPLIEIYRPLPALAYFALLVLLFGTGETSKILVLFLGGLPPVVLAAREAAATVRVDRVQAARSMGLSPARILRVVILPSCLPEIVTGARIGFGLCFTTLVAAEMIAANSGLGWMVYQASQYAESAVVMIGLVAMGFTGVIADICFRLLQARLTPWVGKA